MTAFKLSAVIFTSCVLWCVLLFCCITAFMAYVPVHTELIWTLNEKMQHRLSEEAIHAFITIAACFVLMLIVSGTALIQVDLINSLRRK